MLSVTRGTMPLPLSVSDNEGDEVRIKGFVSLDVVDRQGEIAPPDEFDINKFMASPSVLVDHQPWRDSRGNPVSAGYPESLHVVTVKKNRDDSSVYNIYDEKTKNVVTTYPKAKLPDISPGTRGLFVFLRVTDPDVASRVRRGEYAGISWVGVTKEKYRLNEKTSKVEKVLTDIDLMEISITVRGPAVPQANFVMSGKTAYAIRLDGLQHPTEETARAFAKDHGFEELPLIKTDNSFFIKFDEPSNFNMERAEAVKCATGCTVLLAPPLEDSVQVLKEQALKLSSKTQEAEMSEQGSATAVESPSVDSSVMDALQQVAKSTEELTAKLGDFSSSQAEQREQLDALKQQVSELTAKTAAFEERLATADEEATTEEASTEEASTEEVPAEGATETVEAMKTAFAEVTNQFTAALQNVIPSVSHRDEELSQKTAEKNDPNAVFDSLFG